MSSPSPERRLALRNPALVFAPSAVMLLFLTALVFATVASAGFSRFDSLAAHGLFSPTLIGLALALIAIAPRLRRGQIASRWDLIRRAAIAFAVAGFVWPLSFGIAVLLQGDAQTALSSLLPALLGLIIGGVGGAVGGALAAYACCTES